MIKRSKKNIYFYKINHAIYMGQLFILSDEYYRINQYVVTSTPHKDSNNWQLRLLMEPKEQSNGLQVQFHYSPPRPLGLLNRTIRCLSNFLPFTIITLTRDHLRLTIRTTKYVAFYKYVYIVLLLGTQCIFVLLDSMFQEGTHIVGWEELDG